MWRCRDRGEQEGKSGDVLSGGEVEACAGAPDGQEETGKPDKPSGRWSPPEGSVTQARAGRDGEGLGKRSPFRGQKGLQLEDPQEG